MMTWRSVSGPHGRGTWQTARDDGGLGADVVLTRQWRGGDVGPIGRTVSGNIGSLKVRAQFWQEAA